MRTQMLFVAAMVCLLGLGLTNIGAQGPKKPQPPQPPDEPKIVKPKFVAPTPARWEYRVLSSTKIGELGENNLEVGLNALGADGWELVAVEPLKINSRYIFRRPLTSQPKPAAKPAPEPAPKEKEETKLEFRVYPLQNAKAVDMAGLLSDVLQIFKYPLRVVADPATNQLLVAGPIDAHVAVRALLECLDRPGVNDAPRTTAPPPSIVLPGKKKKGPPSPE
jgi:Bacterial type II/III secretion system short domain